MHKLSSGLPLVWRTPTSLQIGIDHPRVVIPKIYPAEERLLSALRVGFSDASLTAVAEECGLTRIETSAFMSALTPALTEHSPAPRWRIAVDGSGPLVDTLGLLLIAAGHHVFRTSAAGAGKTDLAIVIGDFALEPHRPGSWLSRDIPHLPVVFSDESVRIGPLLGSRVSSKSTLEHYPCEQCIVLTQRDQDECWVAMMSQLVGTAALSQTPIVNAEVSSLIARWIESPTSHPVAHNTAVVIDTRTGGKDVVTFALHPDCACQALPRNVSVLGSSHGQFPVAPTTKKVASSLS